MPPAPSPLPTWTAKLTHSISVAVGAAIYASSHKLLTDKTLRLSRNKPEDREH